MRCNQFTSDLIGYTLSMGCGFVAAAYNPKIGCYSYMIHAVYRDHAHPDIRNASSFAVGVMAGFFARSMGMIGEVDKNNYCTMSS